MTPSNFSRVPIAKSTLDKYLNVKRGLRPPPDSPVYQAVLYLLQNPGAQGNIAEQYNLTPEQHRMVNSIIVSTRDYQRRVSKLGSIY